MTIENRPELSIIVPVYNEQENILELYYRLEKTLTLVTADYEIIFCDDGSSDESWNVIALLNQRNKNVRGLKLSKNFGHQFALKAGLVGLAGCHFCLIPYVTSH